MISKEFLSSEFKRLNHAFSNKNQEINDLFHAQIYSGISPRQWKNQKFPATCNRHQLLFNSRNVIARYCFNCFKIMITVKNVEDLFKLNFLFKGLNLPDNNTRKCMINFSPSVEHHYCGYIYFQSYEESVSIYKAILETITTEISDKVLIKIKRGCSNYSSAYPDFGKFNSDFDDFVEKNKVSFELQEDLFNKSSLADSLKETSLIHHPIKKFTNVDFAVMKKWLSYAKTIGDSSFRNICGENVEKIKDLEFSKFPSF